MPTDELQWEQIRRRRYRAKLNYYGSMYIINAQTGDLRKCVLRYRPPEKVPYDLFNKPEWQTIAVGRISFLMRLAEIDVVVRG